MKNNVPIKYHITGEFELETNHDGNWVLASDYDALRTQRDELVKALELIATRYERGLDAKTTATIANDAYDMRCIARQALLTRIKEQP